MTDLPNDEPLLLRADREGVATLTLNRPKAYNTLSRALMGAMQAELDAIGRDPAVRVVVVAGNGPAFCAGHDLREMRADPSRTAQQALFDQCSRLMLTLTRIPQPVIARVHGAAAAAGCQLVATCDLAVASEAAKFGTPGVKLGLFCSTPMVALTRAVGRKEAMRLLVTGDIVDARTAERIGLVNETVAPEALDDAVAGLAARIAAHSGTVVAIGKTAFYRQMELGLDEAYAYASGVMVENMMKQDAAEGIDAFLEKRPPVWRNG